MIVASLLSIDLAHLAKEAENMLLNGIDQFHIDIMDGQFVSNITLDPCAIKSLLTHLTNVYLDCHLMTLTQINK